MAENEKKTYVVKPGFTHGVNDRYKAGDTLELTAHEATGMSDKLELYDPNKNLSAKPKPNLRDALASATDEEILAIPGLTRRDLEHVRAFAGGPAIIPSATPVSKTDSNATQGSTADQFNNAESGNAKPVENPSEGNMQAAGQPDQPTVNTPPVPTSTANLPSGAVGNATVETVATEPVKNVDATRNPPTHLGKK